MKQIKYVIALLFVALTLSGCQPDFSEAAMDKVVEDIKKEAVKQLKKALRKELEEFFAADELASTLGISSQDLKLIENAVKNYVENYEFDEESLKEIIASADMLLNNTEGLSAEELEKKLKEIFGNFESEELEKKLKEIFENYE